MNNRKREIGYEIIDEALREGKCYKERGLTYDPVEDIFVDKSGNMFFPLRQKSDSHPFTFGIIEIYTDERIAEFEAVAEEHREETERRFKEKGWVYDAETVTIRDMFGNIIFDPFQRDNVAEPYTSESFDFEPLMVCEKSENPYRANKEKKE